MILGAIKFAKFVTVWHLKKFSIFIVILHFYLHVAGSYLIRD